MSAAVDNKRFVKWYAVRNRIITLLAKERIQAMNEAQIARLMVEFKRS